MTEDIRLRTGRLLLRPLVCADASPIQAIVSDAKVALTTASIPHPYPDDGATQFIARSQRLAGPNQRNFAVTLGDADDLIGLVGFSGSDGIAEIRYLIAPDNWGRGYATEAAGAVVHYLLSELGFGSLVATAMASNGASVRVLQKLGFAKGREAMMDLPLRGGRHLVSAWRFERSPSASADASTG